MGFWIFMLIMVLLIPITMVGFGRLFMRKAPNDINYVFGYRTKRSMQNKATWSFAHKYVGRIWCICGVIMIPAAIIPMIFMLGKETNEVGTMGGIITVAQICLFIGSIFPTENALKKNFDEFCTNLQKIGNDVQIQHKR